MRAELSLNPTRYVRPLETAHVNLFRTWPGDCTATVKHLVCDGSKAICIIDFAIGESVMTGISIFEVQDGLIHKVTDYWPEPYEPPPRQTAHLKRRSSAA